MKRKNLRAFWLKWHRRIGITAAIFLILIALTGAALNHARFLGMDHIYLETGWILKAYNMEMPEDYIQSVTRKNESTVVETKEGTFVMDAGVEDVNAAVARDYRGPGITLEKLMLDLHTGKIIGLPGTVLSDLAAVAILLLTGTGVYNWWKRRR